MGQKNQGCHASEAVGKVSQGRGTVENPSQAGPPPPPSVLFPGFKSGTEIKGKEFTWTHIPQIPGTCHITWRLEASEDVAGMTHHGVLRSEGHQKIAARESREFQTGYITFTGTGDTTSSSRSTYLAIPCGKSRLKGTFIKYQK